MVVLSFYIYFCAFLQETTQVNSMFFTTSILKRQEGCSHISSNISLLESTRLRGRGAAAETWFDLSATVKKN